MPDLKFPQLSIVTEYSLAGPREIENLVTKPIEETVGTVKNVRRIRSVSKEGRSIVTVEFTWGTNMDFASLNLREKLDLVKAKLPSDAKEPTVVKYDPFKMPILILSLSMEGDPDPLFLSTIAEKTIATQIQKVNGVAAVTLSGVREEEIHVDLEQTRLAANGVSFQQVVEGLGKANYLGSAGSVSDDAYDYSVRVKAGFETPQDVAKAVIAVDNPNPQMNAEETKGHQQTRARSEKRISSGDQRIIQLGQLGSIQMGLKERESYSRRDGKEIIALMIQKQSEAATIDTVERVKEKLRDIQLLLPSDVQLAVVYDQGTLISKGIQDVLNAIFFGALLAFLILFFFLGSSRDAAIVSLVIPVSTLGSILIMKMMGISLNTISLGGLALGIGMLVDAAICVTENIHRLREEGKSLQSAAIDGTMEVAGPILSSSLTTISVFLPLIFVVGLIGQLFKDLSLTVTISQLVSILVALTLVPMVSSLIGKKDISTSTGPNFNKIQNKLKTILVWSFKHPGLLWGAILCIFIFSLFILSILPKQFLPNVDSNQLVASLKMPEGTRLDKTNRIVSRLEETIKINKSVSSIMTNIGSSSDSPIELLEKNESALFIDLHKERSESADQLKDAIIANVADINLEGGKFELTKAGGPLSLTDALSSPVMVSLYGNSLVDLKSGSDKLMAQLNAIDGVRQVRSSLALPAPEIKLDIDKQRAARIGLTLTDIAKTAQGAFYGQEATRIYKEGKEVSVLVRLQESDRKDVRQLRTLLVMGQQNHTWPLQEMADVELGEGPSQIERLDQQRTVLVRAEYAAGAGSAPKRAVEKVLLEFNHSNITVDVAGEKQTQRESFLSLAMTLVVAILLVYGVMAIQFESLKQPFFILFTIPLSVIGMAFGLFAMGKTLNAISSIGLLLLAGIVVNNGIVLIDFVNNSRGDKPLKEVLIEAALVRLRPILMTAATTIVGLIPLALGLGEGAELQAPMAITVIFGLLFSTVLTLVGLPSLYLMFEGKGNRTP